MGLLFVEFRASLTALPVAPLLLEKSNFTRPAAQSSVFRDDARCVWNGLSTGAVTKATSLCRRINTRALNI